MEEVVIKGKTYHVEKPLDDEHYLVSRKGKQYVYVDYRLDEALLQDFIQTYKKIKITGIIYPKIIAIDQKNKAVLMEYIPGPTALEELVKGELNDDWYNGIFLQARYAKVEKYALDFDPINFKLYQGRVYYLKFTLLPYDDSKAFHVKDVYRWVYSKELVKELNERGIEVDKSRLKDDFTTNKETVLLVVKYYR